MSQRDSNGDIPGHLTANGHAVDDADENTPLIAHAEPPQLAEPSGKPPAAIAEPTRTESEEDVPLNKTQIFLLCYVRCVEPVAFFSIFPFVPQMIFETGDIRKTDVGFWAGLIESLFSVTQMSLMLLWGRAADRWGRKPVLVGSMWGVACATVLFGFSRTLWQMVLFRCLAGVFAGTVVTVRAMITENCTPRTQAQAFSYFAFSGNVGIFLGPLLGGALAKPAESFPGTFGGSRFFNEYPYALPTIVTGAYAMTAALVSTFLIKETMKPREQGSEPYKPVSVMKILKADGVIPTLFIYGYVSLLGLAFTAVIPVFWFEPVELGGYGFSPKFISVFMALGGLSQSVWLLFAFPPLVKRIGTGGVLRLCAYCWPIFYSVAPIANVFLRQGWTAAFWIVGTVNQLCGSGVAMAFTGVQLALNAVSPGQREFGTLNAMALALTAGIRSFAPVLFASLYAMTVKAGWIGGEAIFLLLIALAIVLSISLQWLPEKAYGRPQPKPRFEGDDSA